MPVTPTRRVPRLVWSNAKLTLPGEAEPVTLKMVAQRDRFELRNSRGEVVWSAPLVSIDVSSAKRATVTVEHEGEPVQLAVVKDCRCGGTGR